MSYCRFSTDNFGCDLYVYASAEGWTTHLAGNRIVGTVPELPGLDDPAAYMEAMKVQSAFIQAAERVPIGLMYAGQTFYDDELGALLQRLLDLREIGYRFPEYVIEAVKEEMAEETQASPLPSVD